MSSKSQTNTFSPVKCDPEMKDEVPASKHIPAWVEWALIAQAVALVLLLCVTTTLHANVRAKSAPIMAVADAVETGAPLPNGLAESLGAAAASTVEAFFLGAPNGIAPAFLSNVLAFDFGGLAQAVVALAQKIQNIQWAKTSACAPTVTCPFGGISLLCPDGSTVQCMYGGQQVCTQNAGGAQCLSANFRSVASAIVSFVQPMAQWNRIGAGASNTTTAAFSDGLLRMDLLPQWLQSQTSSNDVKVLGRTCLTLAQQLKNINWAFGYVDTNGNYNTADINSGMGYVAAYMTEVGHGLALMQ